MRSFLFTAAIAALVSLPASASPITSWPTPAPADEASLKKLQALPPASLSCEHHGPTVLVEDAYGNDLEIPSREGETCCNYEGSGLCCTNWADGGAPTCNTPPADPSITLSDAGGTFVAEDRNFDIVADGEQLSWCRTDATGTACGHVDKDDTLTTPTAEGCHYKGCGFECTSGIGTWASASCAPHHGAEHWDCTYCFLGNCYTEVDIQECPF